MVLKPYDRLLRDWLQRSGAFFSVAFRLLACMIDRLLIHGPGVGTLYTNR